MGLDMYLSRKTYVKRWDHLPKEEQFEVAVKKGGKSSQEIDTTKISYVVEEVAYWRKANHIHKWFVENCQDGVDNCQEAYVSHGQLLDLYDTCVKVAKSLEGAEMITRKIKTGVRTNKEGQLEAIMSDHKVFTKNDTLIAETELPTESGFFFGGTDYDEWYLEAVKETIQMLEHCVSKPSSGEFYYESSW